MLSVTGLGLDIIILLLLNTPCGAELLGQSITSAYSGSSTS